MFILHKRRVLSTSTPGNLRGKQYKQIGIINSLRKIESVNVHITGVAGVPVRQRGSTEGLGTYSTRRKIAGVI